LVFDFDVTNKTIWLEEGRQVVLPTILHQLIWGAKTCRRGIPFGEFESITVKIRHAFTTLTQGWRLMSPCNWVMGKRPQVVNLNQNCALNKAICNIQGMLQNSVSSPTHCKDLVASWPDCIRIVDASSHGVGGVVVGELPELPPTVFRLQCPPEITNALATFDPQGKINNSDLEMAGLLLLWLCIEGILQTLEHKHVALFSNNAPTISWVERMASRKSCIMAQLVRVL
jgi:hypothetical protein